MKNTLTLKSKASSTLRKIIFKLMMNNDLTAEKMERLHSIAISRGLDQNWVQNMVFDCQIEYCIE